MYWSPHKGREIGSYEGLLGQFPSFCLCYVANLHRVPRNRVLLEPLLSMLSIQMEICLDSKNEGKLDGDVIFGFEVIMHCLFLVIVHIVHYLWNEETRSYLYVSREAIKRVIDVIGHNTTSWRCRVLASETMAGKGMVFDQTFQLHRALQTLFDEDLSNKRRFRIYRIIRKRSRECRAITDTLYGCSNGKCSKGRRDCGFICSKCRTTGYCSRKCQKYDWNRGDHKEQCPRYFSVLQASKSNALQL